MPDDLAQPLVTGRERRGQSGPLFHPIRIACVAVAWGLLVGSLLAVGVLVTHSTGVQDFDKHVTSVVVAHRSAGLNAAMKAVTWLGSWVALVVTAVVVLVLVLRKMLPVGFLLLAVSVWGGTQLATAWAKHVVQRPRPPEHLRLVSAHGWSWPSGHTATATVLFGVLAAAVWVLAPRTVPRVLALVVWVVAMVVVAYSRVELGVHWTTDVLASMTFVAAWLGIVGVLFAPLVGHRSAETPHA